MRFARALGAFPLVALTLVGAACGGGGDWEVDPVPSESAGVATTTRVSAAGVTTTVVGVVIDVEGSLAGIEWFVLRLQDGSDLALVPQPGLLFDGVGPLSHLRDHLVSGSPIRATYTTVPDGLPLAVTTGDSGAGNDDE